MAEALLVVDVQEGFLNEFTHHIPERVARLIEGGHYDPILFTRFINSPGSPYHRLLDWHGCEREPETNLAPEIARLVARGQIFVKAGFTGVSDELTGYLREQKIERISLAGIDTDMCVLKIAMDLFDLGIEPIVLNDCCASTSGLQAHLAGLAILSRNIGAQRLRDAGLGEGQMAAPSDVPHAR
ncbi:MAG TPA: isochorismatase family cysteine hydrolase [Chloroflexota bacterium]|nr:isochorismatase family cysteine hydrolase [Chloroflexota bacterium]